MNGPLTACPRAALVLLLLASIVLLASNGEYPSAPEIVKAPYAITLQDFVRVPQSGGGQLARANVLRFEPGTAPEFAARFFLGDLNGTLYIVDVTTKSFTTYIDFEAVFPKFVDRTSLGTGFATLAFDPRYESNGRFYTVHTESPTLPGPDAPVNGSLPGLDLTGYATTASIDPPVGVVDRQAVLMEWTDSDLTNATFEGTAREVMRIGFNFGNHAIADMLFNPAAGTDDEDFGNLYIAVGDGGAGQRAGETHSIPQRLDALPGKILRITPDVSLRPTDLFSSNSRYRIPTGADPNPFAAAEGPGVFKEIFAYGFRNPHQLTWDAPTGALIVSDIGVASWEELNIVRKGGNYGFGEREGTEQLFVGDAVDHQTGSQITPPVPFPSPDSLAVSGLSAPVTPRYPVALYSHHDGDAIAGGVVYRGALLPQLKGKYVFGDITTGRVFYADIEQMLAADDDDRTTVAPVRELQVLFDSPYDSPDNGVELTRMFDVVAHEYAARGGAATRGGVLPGAEDHMADGIDPDGIIYGGGRADIRFAVDRSGELYVISKSDGLIRAVSSISDYPVSVPSHAVLSLSIAGPGSGLLTSTPVGVICDATCSPAFRRGATVTLHAAPNSTSVFAGWSGACDGVGSCTMTITEAASLTATFARSPVDLVAAVTAAPQVAAPGASMVVGDTTTNQGATAAGSSATRYYLSADTARDATDTALGARTIEPLAAGAQSTLSLSIAVASTTPLGDYFLLACADSQNVIGEGDELNNCGASAGTITVTRPDLVTTSVGNPPAQITPGGAFTAKDTARNQGGYTSGKTNTRYYLSVDSTRGPGDILLSGIRSVTGLSPGTSSVGSRSVTVPSSTPLGTYVLLACVDDPSKVTELVESNNCLAAAASIRVDRPDLAIATVSNPPAAMAPGMTFAVTSKTVNQGNAPSAKSTTRFYLSSDAVKDAADVRFSATRSVNVLAAGVSATSFTNVTVPTSIPPGSYRLLACADDLAVVTELDETNNCTSAAATMDVRLPDLAQIAVSSPPAVVSAGGSFTISDTVANHGAIATGSTSTRYYLSLDTIMSAEDVLLTGSRSVNAVAPGASNTGSKTVTVPSTTPATSYYVLACADGAKQAVESREDNNCAAAAAKVTVP